MNNLSVVIPVAGSGRRMKSYGSKSLLHLSDGRSILRRQIDIFKRLFDKFKLLSNGEYIADIVVVVGFDADKIYKTLPDCIRIVENENFDSTGVARSISLGIKATISKKVLVVYGDLVFNKEMFETLPDESCIFVDSKGRMNSSEVGIIIDGDNVVHLDYGLKTKWCHSVLLTGKELALFKTITSQQDKRKLSGHEILNLIIEKGGEFKAFEPKKMKLIEVDSNKDLEKANSII